MLDEFPEVEEEDVVAYPTGLPESVRDEEHRVVLLELEELVLDVLRVDWVQRARRLIT